MHVNLIKRKVIGAAALAILVATSSAFGKGPKGKDFGTYQVGCLAADTALQTVEGIQNSGTSPAVVSISPATLWPPNHKMSTESVAVGLTQAITSPGGVYGSGADIKVWVTGLTDDQIADETGKGQGCGQPTAKQGPDWTPDVSFTDPNSYIFGEATGLSDTTLAILSLTNQSAQAADISLRAERCARDGTREYSVYLVCCDTTNPSSVICDDPALLTQPPGQPATTELDLVTVPKNQSHRHP